MGAMKLASGLTPKQAKFIKVLVKTGNATEAAAQVYDVKSRLNAKVVGQQNIKKPIIKKTLEQALRKAGIDEDSFADYLKKPLIQEKYNFTGADYLKTLEMAGKFMGWDKNHELEKSYKITISKLPTKELKMELEKRVKISTHLIEELKNL